MAGGEWQDVAQHPRDFDTAETSVLDLKSFRLQGWEWKEGEEM